MRTRFSIGPPVTAYKTRKNNIFTLPQLPKKAINETGAGHSRLTLGPSGSEEQSGWSAHSLKATYAPCQSSHNQIIPI